MFMNPDYWVLGYLESLRAGPGCALWLRPPLLLPLRRRRGAAGAAGRAACAGGSQGEVLHMLSRALFKSLLGT